MATGKTGYIDLTPSVSWAKVRAYYTETYDLASNTSDLTITSIQVQSSSYYGVSYYIDGLVKINGTTVLTLDSSAGTALVTVSRQNTWYTIVDAEDTAQAVTAALKGIAHNNDGSKTISIEFAGNRFSKFAFYAPSGGYGSGWGISQTQSVALTDIPRASPVAATDAAIGSVSTVTVTRRSAAYTHSVGFSFGNLSGWLDADGTILASEKKLTAASIPFALPDSFYAQIPDAASGICTLRCTTYSGTAQIGDVQTATFRVTPSAALCAPVVSGAVEDVNPVTLALTGDKTVLVRGASTALCTISAQAQNSATISRKQIGGVTVTADTRTIEEVETGTIVFAATDSRGYTTSVPVTVELVAYIHLTTNVSAWRTDPTSGKAVLSIKGNYYSGSFGGADNTLRLEYTAGEQTGTVDAAIDGNTYSAQVELEGLDYRSSHTITVTAADAIQTVSRTVTLGKGIPVFDWGENDFVFHVPVALEGGFTAGGKGLLDLVYPVDYVYMSAADTTPAFGGTWVPVENQLGLYLWKRTA